MSKTPPYSGLGAKPFLAPPTKADIATAILTNVIEHLVLLLPPNKHAFTAKAVWADLIHPNIRLIVIHEGQISVRYFSDESDDLNHGGYGGCFFFPWYSVVWPRPPQELW